MKETTARTAALHAGTDPDLDAGAHEDEYLCRFGSRLGLDLGRGDRALLPVGLGPLNTNLPVYLAVDTPAGRFSAPTHFNAAFVRGETVQVEHRVERSMTRLRFRGEAQPPGLTIEWEFLSPFYPQDDAISSAPVFRVSCRLIPRSVEGEARGPAAEETSSDESSTVGSVSASSAEVTVLAGLEATAGTRRDATMITQEQQVAANFRGPETKPGALFHCSLAVASEESGELPTRLVDNGAGRWLCLARRVDFGHAREEDPAGAAGVVEVSFYLASVIVAGGASGMSDGVVDRLGESCSPAFRREFADAPATVDWARRQRAELLEKSRRFDELFTYASIPDHIRRFAAWQFHSFLGSTWLLRRRDGSVFYTNYEGGTGYFSTVDVEYNLAPIYLMFRPQCLVDQLDLWAEVYRRGNRLRPHGFGPTVGVMEHDVGGGFSIDEQIYMPGPMPVEENANYILMHYLYWRWTGDRAVFDTHAGLCRELADYIVAADTNGNGLPNRGTNNTFDAFEPLFRDTEDQVYLGVKAGAALQALAELLGAAAQGREAGAAYAAHARLIFGTVEAQAWRGDHYAVSISPTAPQGPAAANRDGEQDPVPAADRDAPSPLSLNGLAYLLFAAAPLPVDAERMRRDLETAAEDYTRWPSMGIWRDMCARYLGHEGSRSSAQANVTVPEPRREYCFRPDFRNDMYPRSATVLFMLNAWAGVGLDMPNRVLTVSRHFEGRVPLPALADWERGKVPWLRVRAGRAELESPTERCAGLSVRTV